MSMWRSIDQPKVDDMLDAAIQNVELHVAARPVEQVETHAANTAIMQSLQFTFGVLSSMRPTPRKRPS